MFSRRWWISLAAAAAVISCSPFAAVAQDVDAEERVEEIIVTGSRIVRRDFDSPSPIVTIDRDALRNTGQVTLEAALNQMPQVTPDFERTANNPGDGTARANLRGLGANRTLVLLNGRRVAPSGVGSSVDINNLPQALVERVEVITGGASTVYGSDAVAGVINVITRNDVEGFGIDVSAYATERGDSEVYDANAYFGHNFANGGNVTLMAGYLDRAAMLASDRRVTSVPLINLGGMLVPGGSTRTPAGVVLGPPADLGSGPVRVTFTPDGQPVTFNDPADRYNFAGVNYLQTPLRRHSAALFLELPLTDRLEAYSELTYTRSIAKRNLAPVPLGAVLSINTDNPVLTAQSQQVFADNYVPVGPNTVLFFFGKRLEELGPRIIEDRSDYTRVVAGLRGALSQRWEFDAWATYTRGDEKTLNLNDASLARVQQGLFVAPSGQCIDPTNGCVPVDLFGAGLLSDEAAAFIGLPPLVNTTDREQKLVSAYVRGPLFELPTGRVESAFGIEWRSDDGSFVADQALFSGDALGFAGSAPVDGSEEVFEVYAETLLPVLSDDATLGALNLELGARRSFYDRAGDVSTYKAGIDWEPLPGFRFRATQQRSVRAPTVLEAFQERFTVSFPFVGADPAEDPCSASADPIGNGLIDKCVATGLPRDQVGVFEATVGFPTDRIRGGNSDLEPESADTLTVGFVLTPAALPDLQLSVDYFDLEVNDRIDQLVAFVACFDRENTEHRNCDAIRRDPVSFDIRELFEVNINTGTRRTRGVDTQLGFSMDVPSMFRSGDASLAVNLMWTRLIDSTIQAAAGGGTLDCAGGFGFPCNFATDGFTYPENRITANLNYLSGRFGGYLTWRWIDGTRNARPRNDALLGTPSGPLAVESIGSRSYVDASFAYELTNNIDARLTIANLLDSSAPIVGDALVSNNTDTRLYDVFGRAYTLGISLAWP